MADEDRRDDRPDDLDRRVAVNRRAVRPISRLGPEVDHRVDQDRADDREDHERDDRREPVDEVDPLRLLARRGRQPGHRHRNNGGDRTAHRGRSRRAGGCSPSTHRAEPYRTVTNARRRTAKPSSWVVSNVTQWALNGPEFQGKARTGGLEAMERPVRARSSSTLDASFAPKSQTSPERIAEEALAGALRRLCRGGSWQGVTRELAWRAVTGGHRDPRSVEPLAETAEAMLAPLIDGALWEVEQGVVASRDEYLDAGARDELGALAAPGSTQTRRPAAGGGGLSTGRSTRSSC